MKRLLPATCGRLARPRASYPTRSRSGRAKRQHFCAGRLRRDRCNIRRAPTPKGNVPGAIEIVIGDTTLRVMGQVTTDAIIVALRAVRRAS